MLKEGFSTVANVILPLVSCFTSRFLPAIISTVLPALMDSPAAPTLLSAFLVPPVVALAFNVKAALFTALATVSTVAILPASLSFTFTVPAVVPVVTGSISPVTTFNPLVSSVVIVVPSVLTFSPFVVVSREASAFFTVKPAVVVSKDVSPRFTLTPSVPTANDLSAGFTEIVLPVVSFCKPLPRFTLYFIVDVLPSVLVTDAVVPSPSTKFTVSYGFTKSFATPLPCKFQPACNTSPTVAALFLFTWSVPVPNVGAVALVVGASVPVLAPTKLPSTLDNVVGVLVPFGPLTVVLIGPVTVIPFPSGCVLKIWLPSSSFLPVGYTRLPSLSVYTTGVTALFVDV